MMQITADTLISKRITKFAGISFLLSLFVPMLNWILVNSKIIVLINPSETLNRVRAYELLFRIGLVNDFLTSVIAIVLAVILYILLNRVNKAWALIAFSLKTIEGVLMATISLCNLAVFLVVVDPGFRQITEPVQILAGIFFNTRMPLASVPMLFLGLNFTIFLSLLYKSNYVPRTLAGFGVVSYMLILGYSILTLLLPQIASNLIIQSVCWAPSCLFELIIGIFLITKGINIQQQQNVG
jgi:hypothetical protein